LSYYVGEGIVLNVSVPGCAVMKSISRCHLDPARGKGRIADHHTGS